MSHPSWAKQSLINKIYFHDYPLRHPHSTTLSIKCQTQYLSFLVLVELSLLPMIKLFSFSQSWKEQTFIRFFPYIARLETTFFMNRLSPFPTSSSTHSLLCLIAFLHKVGQSNSMNHHSHYSSVWLTAYRQENSSPKSFPSVNQFSRLSSD